MGPAWLAHHGPADRHRCLRVGSLHLCRRCLTLWPATYLLFGLQILLRVPPAHGLDTLVPLLLLPPVLEFIMVHVGRWDYTPSRVWLMAPLFAASLARLFYRLAHDPWDPWATALLWISGAGMFGAAMAHHLSRRRQIPGA